MSIILKIREIRNDVVFCRIRRKYVSKFSCTCYTGKAYELPIETLSELNNLERKKDNQINGCLFLCV